jgi:hypothetical protein
VEVIDNRPIDVAALDQSRPITIGGSGILQAASRYEEGSSSPTTQLWLTVLTIEPEAQLIGKDLVVQTSLRLESGARLAAAPLDKITLVPGVELEFHCDNLEELPHLDLGDIGENYSVVPSLLKVVINSSSSDEVHKPLVQGRTLSNCDQWKAKVEGLPREYEAQCEPVSSSGQSLLANGPVIGLFIVNSAPEPTKAVRDDGGSNAGGGLGIGVIVGIVIGAVVVIGVAVGAIWFFVLRKKDDSGEGLNA